MRVALQFSPEDLKDSPGVCAELTGQTSAEHEFYVVLTASCGVDFLAPLRLGTDYVQAIVAFGSGCDSLCLTFDTPFADLPVLFVFGDRLDDAVYSFTKHHVSSLLDGDTVLFYDLKHISLACKLVDDGVVDKARTVKVALATDKWTFSDNIHKLVADGGGASDYGHFTCSVPEKDIKSVVWIGKCENLFFRTCGWNMKGVDPDSKSEWSSEFHKELTKRLALIEKVKAAKTIGIVFTNTLASVDATLERIQDLLQRHSKDFIMISFLQSCDSTKFGNFGEVDVFVLSSACSCGSLILQTKTHVPLISLIELEIALGVKRTFGGLEWNTETEEEPPDVEEGTSSTNEIRAIMELKDCMKSNWFGLEVAAGEHEAAVVEEGSTGVASAYANEPQPSMDGKPPHL